MIFNTKLLLVSVFLLITIVHNTSSARHRRHNGKNHHEFRHHRSIFDNEVEGSHATSCGEPLCTSLNTYPERKITSAFKQFQRLIRSDKTVFERVMVDSGYVDHVMQRNNANNSYEETILKKFRCTTTSNIIYPLEGKSKEDKQLYYIINVKDQFSQSVDYKTCNHCDGPSSEFCVQAYRNEKLLAIPIQKRSFTGEDVIVRTFEVPYSCDCYAFDK